MAHAARLLEELFVNVETLLHTDDLAISFHPEKPDGSPELETAQFRVVGITHTAAQLWDRHGLLV
jgi:hypothetical protein